MGQLAVCHNGGAHGLQSEEEEILAAKGAKEMLASLVSEGVASGAAVWRGAARARLGLCSPSGAMAVGEAVLQHIVGEFGCRCLHTGHVLRPRAECRRSSGSPG